MAPIKTGLSEDESEVRMNMIKKLSISCLSGAGEKVKLNVWAKSKEGDELSDRNSGRYSTTH